MNCPIHIAFKRHAAGSEGTLKKGATGKPMAPFLNN